MINEMRPAIGAPVKINYDWGSLPEREDGLDPIAVTTTEINLYQRAYADRRMLIDYDIKPNIPERYREINNYHLDMNRLVDSMYRLAEDHPTLLEAWLDGSSIK